MLPSAMREATSTLGESHRCAQLSLARSEADRSMSEMARRANRSKCEARRPIPLAVVVEYSRQESAGAQRSTLRWSSQDPPLAWRGLRDAVARTRHSSTCVSVATLRSEHLNRGSIQSPIHPHPARPLRPSLAQVERLLAIFPHRDGSSKMGVDTTSSAHRQRMRARLRVAWSCRSSSRLARSTRTRKDQSPSSTQPRKAAQPSRSRVDRSPNAMMWMQPSPSTLAPRGRRSHASTSVLHSSPRPARRSRAQAPRWR